jgi:hypothetical protein
MNIKITDSMMRSQSLKSKVKRYWRAMNDSIEG